MRVEQKRKQSSSPKKQKQQMRRFWRLEYKSFINSLGDLGLEQPFLRFLKRKPAKVGFKTRFNLAIAILKAPGLARKGKLVEYLDKRWQGKGLKTPNWTEYSKVNGLIRFNCRTQTAKPGELVQIQVNETYWPEDKALGLLDKDQIKMYNEAQIKG